MSSSIRPLLVFACGLYIGKYHPQYVPLPQLSKENINKALKYLESMERQTTQPVSQSPAPSSNTPN